MMRSGPNCRPQGADVCQASSSATASTVFACSCEPVASITHNAGTANLNWFCPCLPTVAKQSPPENSLITSADPIEARMEAFLERWELRRTYVE